MRRSARDLHNVAPGVGVLERVRRIGVEEAAAVGAELLDDFLARHRSDRNGLLRPFERGRVDGAGESLRNAERHKDEGENHRDRQEDVERHPGQIDPEIADRRGGRAGESAHQREGHREAGRGRQEVVHGEAEHLGQMAHRGLAGIVLPVGVSDKTVRGVEREIGRHGVEAARIERQEILQPLQSVQRQETRDGKDDHGDCIAIPVLFARRIDPGQAVEPTLDRAQHRPQKGSLASVHTRHERAERYGAGQNEGEHQRNLRPANKRHREFLGFRIFRDGSMCRGGKGRAALPPPVR